MKHFILSIVASLTLLSAAYNDLGTDYNLTQTKIYNDNGSIDPFIHNLFLGFIKESRPDLMMNKGAFGATFKGQQPGFDYNVIAKVHRSDNSSPMYIDMWFNFGGEILYAQFKVDEAPSTTHPYGVWSMQYSNATGSGIAVSSKDGDFQNLEWKEIYSGQTQTMSIRINASAKTGEALSNIFGNTVGVGFNASYMDYNSTHYVDLQNFSSKDIWQYGLYDATTGSEIKITTGIPFQFSLNNQQCYGYANKDFIYAYSPATMSDINVTAMIGQTVTDYNQNTYTLIDVAGSPKLSSDGSTAFAFTNPISLISDNNLSIQVTFYGEWLDAWDSATGKMYYFDNGELFNSGAYVIKQKYGTKIAVKLPYDGSHPQIGSNLTVPTLTASDVQSLIGAIPVAPLKLRYGVPIN